MRYSDEVIEEVRAGNDIVDVISAYVSLKKKGSNYFGLCPFHGEKTPSFSVSRQKQMYYCFGCGAGGNVFTFLMQYENLSFQEAVQELADRAGITLPQEDYSRESREKQERREVLLNIQKDAAKYYYAKLRSRSGTDGMRYLKNRELSDETIRKFGLGFSGRTGNELYRYLRSRGYSDDLLNASGLFRFDERRGVSDKFWNRVMFPIMDARSRVIGFGGRVMGDGEPKYLNSPETEIFDKSRNLYGLFLARKSRKKYMILCEGYMDVISMHQAGFDNAVASLGTSLTAGHCSLLKRYTDLVLLLYDSDEAGIRAALRAAPMLREAGITSKVVHLDPHKDPDEFIKAEGSEAFQERLDQAENSFLFTIHMLERNYDMADPQGKSEFLRAAAREIVSLEDEVDRETYIPYIAHEYGIENKTLLELVRKESLSGTGRRAVREPKSLNSRAPKKNDAAEAAQRLLIGWEASDPRLIDRIAPYLSVDDFTNPFYHEIAVLLSEQAADGKVSPAAILSRFPDQEEQRRAAEVFSVEQIPEKEDEKEKAIFDVVCRIKKDSIDKHYSDLSMTDLNSIQRYSEERKKLDQLRNEGFPKGLFRDIGVS
ncbi:MAG: DNA primase [Bilifractor sp.]|jgi:DNA primase